MAGMLRLFLLGWVRSGPHPNPLTLYSPGTWQTGKAEANSIIIIEFTDNNVTHTASVQADDKGNWPYKPGQPEIGAWTFSSKTQGGNGKSSDFVINIESREYNNSGCDFNYIPAYLNEYLPSLAGLFGKVFILNKTYDFDNGFSFKPIAGRTCLTDVSCLDDSMNMNMWSGSKTEFTIPASKTLEFDYAHGQGGRFHISFYDAEGRLINHQYVNVPANGPYHKEFSFENKIISSFFIEVYDEGGIYFDNLVWKKETTSKVDTVDKTSSIFNFNAENILKDFAIEDVLSKGQKDLFIDDGKTQLMVNGNQGDTVRLEDILPEGSEQRGWTEQTGTVTIAGTQYHVFSHGDAELLVQDGVTVNLV
ncbi:MAG: hypothetical protein FT714_03255 [Pantoea sp. Pent]|nr:hypothetical protein [Pantoea sp. Pent]